jgi:hypothetical protein
VKPLFAAGAAAKTGSQPRTGTTPTQRPGEPARTGAETPTA